MKEQMQDKALEIITAIQSAVNRAGDFAAEQIPDIAMQYVTYGRVWNTVLAAVISTGFFIALYYSVKWSKNREYQSEWGPMLILPFVGTFCMGVVTMASIKNVVLVWFAPKIWLIQQLSQLVNPK